jgi:hypothetical protein
MKAVSAAFISGPMYDPLCSHEMARSDGTLPVCDALQSITRQIRQIVEAQDGQ